jgi:hypothetical protein
VANDTANYLPLDDNHVIDRTIRPRVSCDQVTNGRGHDIIDLCISSQIRILNGRVMGDLHGKYTFYKNGVSTIDLCMVDENVF